MARKPSEPSPKSTGSKTVEDAHSVEQQARAAVRVEAAGKAQTLGERAGPTETVGPVMITRLRKGDGRALILYSTDSNAGGRA
jgi:hypothetical protein